MPPPLTINNLKSVNSTNGNVSLTGANIGTAFNGLTPSDKTNPYNTIIYKQNAYNVTVTANRNPYLYAIGYGVNFMVLGYNFRVERAFYE